MRYPFAVKYNGVNYEPGVEIPGSDTTVNEIETTTDNVVETEEDVVATAPYTKTEIMRANVDALHKLARQENIRGWKAMNGTALRKELLAKYDL